MESYRQIKSPTSGAWIYIHGDAYQKLLSSYTPDYLLSLPTRVVSKGPKSPKTIKRIKYSQQSITPTLAEKIEVSQSSLTDIPTEVIEREVMFNMNVEDVIHLCETSKLYMSLCDDDLMWQHLYRLHYGDTGMEQYRPEFYGWFDLVKLCYQLSVLMKNPRLKLEMDMLTLYQSEKLFLSDKQLTS